MKTNKYFVRVASVDVELVLSDRHGPDALGERGTGREPHVHGDIARAERAPTHRHLSGRVCDGGGEVVDGVDRLLDRVLVQIYRTESVDYALGISDFDRELLLSEVQVLELFPQKTPPRNTPIVVIKLIDAFVAQTQPIRNTSFILTIRVLSVECVPSCTGGRTGSDATHG